MTDFSFIKLFTGLQVHQTTQTEHGMRTFTESTDEYIQKCYSTHRYTHNNIHSTSFFLALSLNGFEVPNVALLPPPHPSLG